MRNSNLLKLALNLEWKARELPEGSERRAELLALAKAVRAMMFMRAAGHLPPEHYAKRAQSCEQRARDASGNEKRDLLNRAELMRLFSELEELRYSLPDIENMLAG